MAKFLSQAWFNQIDELNESAGELNLPPSLSNLIINVTVTGTNADLHLKNGKLYQGLTQNATSSITIDGDTLNQIIKTKDTNLAIEAFMTGKIRVHGDMTSVMALQSAKPSQEQKALYGQILAMTEFT
ncbi:SCP2 sterol-binding domain-containing protein [Moraxella nasovis]|uniref:SCP2 sterol-binding domain-containing protein n=1 Tax=Moraxella nasovis TaxID=2904121 RepID=UPI001F60C3B2|nr:SCP2 sterol-binding domain-containing protein [Moraxella nasovis]UNU72947.1 SCP2 sterol-binding domain-containing protein [Moraxella nasovis]